MTEKMQQKNMDRIQYLLAKFMNIQRNQHHDDRNIGYDAFIKDEKIHELADRLKDSPNGVGLYQFVLYILLFSHDIKHAKISIDEFGDQAVAYFTKTPYEMSVICCMMCVHGADWKEN